ERRRGDAQRRREPARVDQRRVLFPVLLLQARGVVPLRRGLRVVGGLLRRAQRARGGRLGDRRDPRAARPDHRSGDAIVGRLGRAPARRPVGGARRGLGGRRRVGLRGARLRRALSLPERQDVVARRVVLVVVVA